jgi:phytanoyl-CoA hydroxylase
MSVEPGSDGSFAQARFARDGYMVLKQVLASDECARLRQCVRSALDPLVGPAEYEADVGYPGAPLNRDAPGGRTPRRLLHAYARDEQLQAIARHAVVVRWLRVLLDSPQVVLSQCHHNCVMTKHPGFSSATAWHQDIRYWSFDRPELVSAWFALGEENLSNGALKVIPGSHRLVLDRGRLDSHLFLRPELPENKRLINTAQAVELEQGDVLLFSSQLYHAAGKNLSSEVKLSPVFTYHAATNQPIPGTRSAHFPGILLDEQVGQ